MFSLAGARSCGALVRPRWLLDGAAGAWGVEIPGARGVPMLGCMPCAESAANWRGFWGPLHLVIAGEADGDLAAACGSRDLGQ